jgi:hypothetical protein
MTFLAPGFFYASLLVAAATVALHFIVTRQPRAGVLPTARFVPDMPATATARATRPSDLLLLLLRVLLVLAIGAGLAKPVLKPSRGATARVILADVSRSVTNVAALRDSVRSMYRDGDIIIAFDSSARTLGESPLDSLAATSPSRARGRLSAGLIAAMRAASMLRERADSLELVVVSPLAAYGIDAATDSIRSLWPGRARIVAAGRAGAQPAATAERGIGLRGANDDPLSAAISRVTAGARVTILRDGSTPADSGIVMSWPVSARPAGSIARAVVDTIGGVTTGESLVVSAFERRWAFSPDSIGDGEVIARWTDGEPAAVEWSNASGCIRAVAVPVSGAGDLVIRDDFARFVTALAGPCASEAPFVPADTRVIAMLQGSGALASRDAFQPGGDIHSWLAPWLLGIALMLAVAEIFVRRRKSQAAAFARARESTMASAA